MIIFFFRVEFVLLFVSFRGRRVQVGFDGYARSVWFFFIQGGYSVFYFVVQKLFGQSLERVVDQEASGQVDQLEFLQSSVDLQLCGGEGRYVGLRGYRYVYVCGGQEGGVRVVVRVFWDIYFEEGNLERRESFGRSLTQREFQFYIKLKKSKDFFFLKFWSCIF